MSTQRILLTFVGAVVSMILAMMLLWYSKKAIAKTMSRRHILHMLKTGNMNSNELTDTAKECRSDVVSPKLIPILMVKLLEEGLVQRTGKNNRYAITTEGLEALKSLDSMSKELKKVADIIQRTSMVSKFMITEAIDRIAMISGIDDVTYRKERKVVEGEAEIPVYDTGKQ